VEVIASVSCEATHNSLVINPCGEVVRDAVNVEVDEVIEAGQWVGHGRFQKG